jgi:predicted nucleic acid-binding protein
VEKNVSSRIYIDTVYVVALINQRDQYHKRASALADQFEGHPLLVTDAGLLEMGNALARNYKKEAVEVIKYFLTSDEVKIVHLTPQLFNQAFAEYEKSRDKEWGLKEWGLIDCVSFVVMRQEGVHQALTFDHHFEQAGFQALLG